MVVTSPMMDLFLWVFLGVAPALLAIRFIWRKPPWWVIVPVIAIIGWASWALFVLSYFDALWTYVQTADNPDPELVERAASDGGPMVFAVFFGWLFALLYAVPWWGAYLLACGVRRRVRQSG